MDWESLDKKMGQENSILRTFCCCRCNTERRKHILLCFVNIHTKPRPHEKGTETKLFFPYSREQSQRARRNIRGVFWDAQSSPGPWGCSFNAGALDGICVCFMTFHHHHHLHPVWFITAPAGEAVYQWSSTYGALCCAVIFRDYCGDWSKLILPVPSAIKISELAHRANVA